jgi:hypothetical protein
MQRGSVRATIGTTPTDVPIGTWVAGQALRYSATGGPGGVPGIDTFAPGGIIIETSGPTSLAVGAILDGEELVRVGATVVGKQRAKALNSAAQVSAVTALADVAGHTYALKSGFQYFFRIIGAYQTNITTTAIRFSANYSGSSSSYNGGLVEVTGATGNAGGYLAQTTLNTAMGPAAGPGAINEGFEFWGQITTTSAGTFAFRMASSAAVASGLTLAAGMLSEIWQA